MNALILVLRLAFVGALLAGAIALVVAFPWLLLVPLAMAVGNSPPWFRS